VAIGILFLRFDGTAGITGVLGLGDTTDLEFEAQRWVADVTSTVPVWVVTAGIAIVAALVAWRRSRPTTTPTSDDDQSDVPEEREETVSS
jgi:hypothetical protein